MRLEEERVGNYLHIQTKPKLLKVVELEVLSAFETQLLEKEQSGCAVLLQDDKVSCTLSELLLLSSASMKWR